jgi:hypothetical protein
MNVNDLSLNQIYIKKPMYSLGFSLRLQRMDHCGSAMLVCKQWSRSFFRLVSRHYSQLKLTCANISLYAGASLINNGSPLGLSSGRPPEVCRKIANCLLSQLEQYHHAKLAANTSRPTTQFDFAQVQIAPPICE